MATLQQTSVEQYYIGWYGKSEDSCASFPLVNGATMTLEHAHFPDPEGSSVGINRPQSTFFKEIREVHANGGAWKSYNGSANTWVSMMNFGVTALECGRTYWIILKPGTDSLDIPEFQFANQATSSYEYRIADSCAPVTPSCTCSAVVEGDVLKVDFDATTLSGTSPNGDIKGVEIVFDNVVFGEKTALSGGNAIINNNFQDTQSAPTLNFYYDYAIRSTSVNDVITDPNKTKSVIGFIDTAQSGTGATKSEIGQIQFQVTSEGFTLTGENPTIADVRVYDSSASVVQYDITRCE